MRHSDAAKTDRFFFFFSPDKLFLRSNEVLPYVLKRKQQGNEYYKAGELSKAMHEYKSCIKAISFVDDPIYKEDLRTLAVQLTGNLAAAHLGLNNYRRVIKYCTQVLEADPKNEKALYRRALALKTYPERLEEARKDLGEAIRINPKSKQLREAFDAVSEEVKNKRKADQLAYGTIFQGNAQIYAKERPRVFFELTQKKKLLGHIEMELFSDRAPKTCENFLQLCVGHQPSGLSYERTPIHRVIEGYIIQGGDVTGGGGEGGRSIFGEMFDDENFDVPTDRVGVLCMANSGPNTNQSQFFITLAPCPDFHGQYVAFGRVVAGKAVLRKIEACEVDDNDRPVEDVVIFKCGQVRGKDRMVDSSDEEA